ncbi:hypothetical protein [Shewanella sp. SM21]|uniref:hypothetical protein n=1 Tax=Shewanella sp. SM21 TaxID=2912793 RepID=UPI0021DAF71F|nr:hypothetical protein [Shewanella sp. SM21]MCU8087659.1 hypothetical protein [Shewanella sp. SM21]
MIALDQAQFDAAMYWADKPIKKYVCTLREAGKFETRIYGATCSDRAAELALDNTELNRESATVTEVRLATPEDLGCVLMPPPSVKAKMLTFAANHKLGEVCIGDSAQQLLIGNLPAIAAVNELKDQHARLCRALVDCLAVMGECEKHKSFPKTFASPVGGLGWDATMATARLLLKGGV